MSGTGETIIDAKRRMGSLHTLRKASPAAEMNSLNTLPKKREPLKLAALFPLTLHVSSVLPAYFIERARDLTETCKFYGMHELVEYVSAG